VAPGAIRFEDLFSAGLGCRRQAYAQGDEGDEYELEKKAIGFKLHCADCSGLKPFRVAGRGKFRNGFYTSKREFIDARVTFVKHPDGLSSAER
jgi:hypothetical protein